jgi:hypothetical protein
MTACPFPAHGSRSSQVPAGAVVEMAREADDNQRRRTFHSLRAGSAVVGFLAGVPLMTMITQGCRPDDPTLLAHLRIPADGRLERPESELFTQQQIVPIAPATLTEGWHISPRAKPDPLTVGSPPWCTPTPAPAPAPRPSIRHPISDQRTEG